MTENRRVTVRNSDGTEIDVTEAVKTLYDLLHSSMDWGSGFLNLEDVIEVTRLAEACGFVNLNGAEEQIAAYLRMWSYCPTCRSEGRRYGGGGIPRLGPVTEHARLVTFSCGHRFTLECPPGQPASLVPQPEETRS